MASPRSNLSALPDSPYAAELQRASPNRRFSSELETEFIRARLSDNRTLIRVACALAALLAAFRGLEDVAELGWRSSQLIPVGLVLVASVALVFLTFGSAFARWYLPVAQIIVPLRNAIVAIPIASAAAHGQLDLLMVLPLMVLGPFFFLGLGFRVAALAVALTVVCFSASAIAFGLALPIAIRSSVFLLTAAIACAIAARHLEKWSRTSFLESRLIAELAQHDALTGTKNRHVFDDRLARLWRQAVEGERSIAILLIDIDHFKAYNDCYGHQAGDQVLRRVAQTLQAFIRPPLDVLARYGGEEFAAVLYDIDGERARDIGERMRRAVDELAIEHRGSQVSRTLTISLGVALIRPTAERRPRGALQLADEALYQAKLHGRNRVELRDEADHRLLVTGIFAQGGIPRGQ